MSVGQRAPLHYFFLVSDLKLAACYFKPPSSSHVLICRWTKDKRTLLVKSPGRSKWVQVRPLPHVKNFPAYYDVRVHPLLSRTSSQMSPRWRSLPFLLFLAFSVTCVHSVLHIWCFRDEVCLLMSTMMPPEGVYTPCTPPPPCDLRFMKFFFFLADLCPDFGKKEM